MKKFNVMAGLLCSTLLAAGTSLFAGGAVSAQETNSAASSLVITCRGEVDYPHNSTTPGYEGRPSVHARAICDGGTPSSISATVYLNRDTVVQMAAEPYTVYNSSRLYGVANSDCVPGEYIGSISGTATFPDGGQQFIYEQSVAVPLSC